MDDPATIAVATTGDGAGAPIVNALTDAFPNAQIYLENPESKAVFLNRRAKAIGWFQTLHQLPVMVLGKFAKSRASRRYQAICDAHGVSFEIQAKDRCTSVKSINDQRFADTLGALSPGLLFLVGTRMLSKRALTQIDCPIVNFHAGINPKYRGLNGGYWALANRDPDNFGSTVHFVDEGVDTGGIIDQLRCDFDEDDTILSYQHQISAQSGAMCVKAAQAVLDGKAVTRQSDLPSRQYYHPTLTGYLFTGLRHGVW